MKNKFLILLIAAVTFTGCTKEETELYDPATMFELEGEYARLVNNSDGTPYWSTDVQQMGPSQEYYYDAFQSDVYTFYTVKLNSNVYEPNTGIVYPAGTPIASNRRYNVENYQYPTFDLVFQGYPPTWRDRGFTINITLEVYERGNLIVLKRDNKNWKVLKRRGYNLDAEKAKKIVG